MFYEYAIEPQAIGSSWVTFRYLIEKFGFDQGRLISEFPKRWFREVYEATKGLPDVEKKKISLALEQARKNKVVRFGRPYNRDAGEWLHNALTEHQRLPFHAIIAARNPTGESAVLIADELDEQHPLMKVARNFMVPRDAASLSATMKELLRFGSRILFIDPFYDPFDARYKATFRDCLNIIASLNADAACEIHYRHHDKKPNPDDLKRAAATLFPRVVPLGMKVTIYCWKEKIGGEDFHGRYLLTDKGGIAIDAGFSAEGPHQNTDIHLMSFDLADKKLKSFSRESADYELVGPVIRVDGNGAVERLSP